MRSIIVLILTAAVLFSGCGRVSESELNSALEKDSSFRKILDTKKRIKREIAVLQEKMQPEIGALKEDLERAHSEYKTKARLVKDSLRKSKSIKKLLQKKKDLSLSGDEVSIWNKRAADMEKEIAVLKKEIEALRNKTALLKTEIRILQE